MLKNYLFKLLSKKEINSSNEAPIFIGGDGRSGTTLLSIILDSHPELAVGPELHFNGPKNLGDYAVKCSELLSKNDPKAFGVGLKQNPDLKLGIQFVKRCRRFGMEYDEVKVLCEETMKKHNNNLELFSERLSLIDSLGKRRLTKARKKYWGIKIMRDIAKAKMYANFWPNAKFIHIIRDGRDVASSQMKEHGTWGYSDIGKAASSWVKLIKQARNCANKNNLNYLEVKYEDLVLNSRQVQEKICEFIGVEWNLSMESHEKQEHSLFENPFNHASIKQVVEPINSKAISRYKTDLTLDEISLFNRIAKETLAELEYDV